MAKEDEDEPAHTPAKRKASTNNVNNGISGPRTPTTARKTSAQKNATPIRKASANAANKTPNSAPARARGSVKKPEPTLLGDFLLGRPSPARKSVKARRKSLDAVKAEMRVNNVQQMQQPGKVQERVKQWQKNNAKAGEPEIERGLDEIVVEYETESEVEAEVKRPARRKSRTPEPGLRAENSRTKSKTPEPRLMSEDVSPRPGRRKERDSEPKEKEPEKPRSKSVAPKKRVISDEHWMKNRRRSPPGKGATIPKNFLQATAINPPVERKIEDWVKRMASPEPPERVETPKRKVRRAESEVSEDKPRSRKVSRRSPSGDRIRVQPSRSPSPDDRIRIKPSKDRPSGGSSRSTPSKLSAANDGIRIRASDVESVQSEIQIKRTRNDGSKRRPKEENDTPTPTPRKKSEHLAPPTESESRSRKTSYNTTIHGDDATSYMSPSPSKRRNRKSDVTESLDEIPFGNSAFSVLDLPLGAEANTMKRAERPEPKRNNSFGVPKVLKRVYTEGMKRVHDTEPARGGPNQPPSIETWLNGTTDPFTDRPATADASLPVPESPVSRMRSFKEDDRTERELTAEREHKQKHQTPKPEKEQNLPGSPLKRGDNRETLPSMGNSPPISPLGLKRTPATRITSSPKAAKKFDLKNAIFDAFKGESAMAKTAIPSPFDFIGLREGHIDPTETESSIVSEQEDIPIYQAPKTSPRATDKPVFEESKQTRPSHSYQKRPPPVAGGPSLSTIASVTSFSNSSSATSDTGTGSELSHTTITQGTVLSGTTGSSLSRGSKKSTSKKEGQVGQTGLKRRLTKHADLVSMLSLPDTTQPGRAGSIRSAHSIRTRRTRLEDATIEDLLREVGEDEVKYMRELNTLVDGVIPVLLTCVLSKSESAVAAGLFDPLAYPSTDPGTSFTQPIVDMGIALERLKSLHKRIPLTDPDSFLHWAEQALKIYEDYLRAWRTGFEDVVVNLAPASRKASLSSEPDMDTLPVNQNGDVIRDSGEVVDVAHLLKAPMRRLKNLSRATKGFVMKRPTKKAGEVHEGFERVNTYRQRRVKEEYARREDMKANNTDTTRAQDPKTLQPAEGFTIDRSRQVSMKDVFKFDMSHSTGQHLVCQVEVTFREAQRNLSTDLRDPSDFLISQITEHKTSLLFPPVLTSNISARKGDTDTELVVMIRGGEGNEKWKELIVLEADEKEVRDEWLEILPLGPFPGIVVQKTMELDPEVSTIISAPGVDLRSVVGTLKKKVPEEPPIGERRRREYEEASATKQDIEEPPSPDLPPPKSEPHGPMTNARKKLGNIIKPLSDDHVYDLKDLNDALARAGHGKLRRFKPEPSPAGRPYDNVTCPFTELDSKMDMVMTGALPLPDKERRVEEAMDEKHEKSGYIYQAKNETTEEMDGMLQIPKLRKPRVENSSTPLKESMRPDPDTMSKSRPTTPRDDGAPPPPAHRSPVTPPTLKNIPAIDSATPKAKNRRGSSPLKHEYQPSAASGASSGEDLSTSSDDYSTSDDSLDELDPLERAEVDDMPGSLPAESAIYGRRQVSPSGSLYSLPNGSLAPSNSASQAPYQRPEQPVSMEPQTFMAMVTYWNGNKWEDIHTVPCKVTVGPGWIDTYEAENHYAGLGRDDFDASTTSLITAEAAVKNPLVCQDLTPNVPIYSSNAIDVQVRSQMATRSRFQKVNHIQYRHLTPLDARRFYATVKYASTKNKKWIALSQERMFNDFGPKEPAAAERRRGWLFRKRSFRRDGAEPEIGAPASVGDSTSSSPLKRFRGGGLFNIGKSSVSRVPGGTAGSSAPTSSSGFSNVSPPDTPGGSQAPSTSFWGSRSATMGTKDIPILLYSRVRHNWAPHGQALLSVSDPQPGQHQASSLDHGKKKHILVTLKPVGKSHRGRVIIDEVLGADAFSRGGNTGIFVTIWRDIVDERGRVGIMPTYGGVSGRTEKWCFQSGRQGDCGWIYTLLKSVVDLEGM
ncbi:uncharacterized protein LY89DRAFT_652505 [Mollisia scopiformis]|uniref:Uncharacterized protein n=1 Tax=Mollisia scopiformis TaxID=149040 RepID=A0A194WZE2_MOLSC|nr:uncharacterized protein LY89DRAFT_652505 [Mollisia scopiformis]KUJ13074.1 hypothetical protein LY89DRAFT_652505 [Mollisia scopiformis]